MRAHALILIVFIAILGISCAADLDDGPVFDAAFGDVPSADLDSDGIPDVADPDIDGDGLSNAIERAYPDADDDGVPNERDLDSDDDTITDRDEGSTDRDGDALPNFVDPDSDGDGVSDRLEAGDTDPATPPAECAIEAPTSDLVLHGDGVPDYLDHDSDNDGVSDAEEYILGMDRCSRDSDADGFGDLEETAYAQVNCPTGREPACECATRDTCVIPPEHFAIVLPLGSRAVRELELRTDVGAADLFFLIDSTESMGPTLRNIAETVGGSDGILAQLEARIDDLGFGAGTYDDFPFEQYGAPPDDAPFAIVSRVQDASLGADAEILLSALTAAGGGDEPESATEALYQTVHGGGASYRDLSGNEWTLPALAADCLAGSWGSPCFRDDALPIVALFTDVCSHNGPPNDLCSDYSRITPEPIEWETATDAMRARNVMFVGINTREGLACAAGSADAGDEPCGFLRETARATDSVDVDGNPMVFDLPGSGRDDFADRIVAAIENVVARIPQNVSAVARDSGRDGRVNAAEFVNAIEPSCFGAAEPCWVAPPNVPSEQAVGAVRPNGFEDVLPRTRLRFRIEFENQTFAGAPRSRVFVAFIDVRGNDTTVLQTRQIYVVVPAVSPYLE